VNDKRPVNLALHTMKFPITAITSILHRITGFLLFFLIPLSLWVLDTTLNSPNSFVNTMNFLHSPSGKFWVWVFLSALLFHLVMGIRHLFMDLGIAETLRGGKVTSWLGIICSGILIILAGVWIWQ